MKDTIRVQVESPVGDYLEGRTDAAADLDGAFTVTTDAGHRYTVHGWTCDVDVVPEPVPTERERAESRAMLARVSPWALFVNAADLAIN